MSVAATKCALVRDILQTPSTVSEIAALLGVGVRNAQLGVWMLTYTGQAETCGKVPNPSDAVKRRKTVNLYRLTKRGNYMLRRDRKRK